MIVVDTNIISYLLIPNEKYNQSATDLLEKDTSWIAPYLWHYEFLSVLALYLRKSVIDVNQSRELYKKACEIVESRKLSDAADVLNLTAECSLSAYDCSYVALAKETRLPLITEDKKILSEFSEVALNLKGYL
ncbi:type II toxin-antitoxin system VapC family toxin [bacterium]|nr:type II toxin-antitoxin system VapC family toxin [bacterium]